MNILLDTFSQKQKKTPIWFMRQAGRYLPEYQKIRSGYKNFMEFCDAVEDVVEVTLQPLQRFDLDAAIIFSDILVIPKALGYQVEFIESKGPSISGKLTEPKASLLDKVANTYLAIEKVKDQLPSDKALIGFAGAPWTLACYIFGKEKGFSDVKRLAYGEDREFEKVFEVLTEKVYEHLRNQIKSGADVVKIFDSWAGILDQNHINKLSFYPLEFIYKKLKREFPRVPIIIFPKGCASHKLNFSPDGLAVSYSENFEEVIKNTDPEIVIQGNLDPTLLEVDNYSLIKSEVEKILGLMKSKKHIFNLGHGITPQAKIENIKFVIECVRSYK